MRHWYRAVFDWAEGVCLGRGADRILVNSRFTQGAFLQAFPSLKLTPTVLYPGVPCAPTGKAKIYSSVFLSLNRFERKKDLQLAIEALALMRNGQASLVVAGGFDAGNRENVEYLAELERLCSSLRLSHARDLKRKDCRVIFAPSVDERQKAELMRSACALLYTPQDEHFGIVPVEAQSRGLPVIAMNSGGPKETVQHGSTGWLCEERSAKEVAQLMDAVMEASLTERERMSERAREWVQRMFSIEAFARNLNAIVHELLQ